MTISRRSFVSAAAGGLFLPIHAVAQDATPLATPTIDPAPVTADVLDDFRAAREQLLTWGRVVADAYMTGDDEELKPLGTTLLQSFFAGKPASDQIADMQTNVVEFTFAAARATWVGWSSGEEITGFFCQGMTYGFTLSPSDAQSTPYPTGTWTGGIELPGKVLEFRVDFTGDAETLAATLTIPEQNLADAALDDVAFHATLPIGTRTAERAMPLGLSTSSSSYSAIYPWGTTLLMPTVVFNEEGLAAGLWLTAQRLLPEDPTASVTLRQPLRLPCDGAWYTAWAGDTELENYHAPVPSQRHAIDLLIWRDGATYRTNGAENADYYAWGQPVLPPCAGRVVEVVNEIPDGNPSKGRPNPAAQQAAASQPAGNHVVIQIARDQFVLVAHMQAGSVRPAVGQNVQPGDVLGLCGSSGNSSEPHIHIHVQTTFSYLDMTSRSIHMAFASFLEDGVAMTNAPLRQSTIVEHVAS